MMNIDNKDKMINIFGWAGLVGLTLLTMLLSHYSNWTAPIQVILWLGWFVIFGYLFTWTQLGSKFYMFANEAKNELYKVVWPSRPETIQTTLIVMAMVVIASIFLWGMDTLIMWTIGKITHLG